MDNEAIKHEAKEEEYMLKHPRTVDMTTCQVDNIIPQDYPDFCDAYTESCTYYGKDMTEKQLDDLNEHETEFVHRIALFNAWGV